jgi:hypothetical protein
MITVSSNSQGTSTPSTRSIRYLLFLLSRLLFPPFIGTFAHPRA